MVKLIFHLCCFSFGEAKSDKEILDVLLAKNRYDKRLLPPRRGKSSVFQPKKGKSRVVTCTREGLPLRRFPLVHLYFFFLPGYFLSRVK